MEMIKKVGIILIIILSMSMIFTLNTAKATQVSSGTEGSPPSVSETIDGIGKGTAVNDDKVAYITPVIRKVLGLVRLLTGLLAIIVIAYTGFEMVTETPEGKKKIKEKMIPIVGGTLLVFMASTIASFIIGVFGG